MEGLLANYRRRSQVSCIYMRVQGNTESRNPVKNKQRIEHMDRRVVECKDGCILYSVQLSMILCQSQASSAGD